MSTLDFGTVDLSPSLGFPVWEAADAPRSRPLRVAILGSGNIGTDLLVKASRSELLEPTRFVGRSLASPGIAKARSLGVSVSDRSLAALEQDPDDYDLVFDATNARDAARHSEVFHRLGKPVIDMTPANVGRFCVPAVNLAEVAGSANLNMVTCGGQASVPLAHAIGRVHERVDYVEVVSSIASRSAGPATRGNLDEYVDTTEAAIERFSGARRAKAILVINPAEPCVHMQTTVSARVGDPDVRALNAAVERVVERMQQYVPGYRLVVPPLYENGRVVVSVRVEGLGDHLPRFAGNLDIINCAAVAAAEELARLRAHHPLRSAA